MLTLYAVLITLRLFAFCFVIMCLHTHTQMVTGTFQCRQLLLNNFPVNHHRAKYRTPENVALRYINCTVIMLASHLVAGNSRHS